MKFWKKVLVANLIIISISLGIVGFFVLEENFTLSKNQAILSATEENNMVQVSLEYEILQGPEITDRNVDELFATMGQKVSQGIILSYTSIYLFYDGKYRFVSDEEYAKIPAKLLTDKKDIEKNYSIKKEGRKHYIYTASLGEYEEKELCVVTRKDISDVYDNLDVEIRFFRIVLILVLVGAAVVMIIISRLLTKPLAKLNEATKEIAKGNYKIKADVKTKDEVGELAESFNDMAGKIDEKVIELQDMVKRRDQFVADFSHEIKTPMTSIIGYAHTMRNNKLSPSEEGMALDYIYSEGKRMEAMGQKLFELIYLRQNDIELEEVMTEELGGLVVKSVTPMLQKKSISLEANIEPAIIGANKELLITAIVNIVDNARKASNEGSSIIFTGELKDNGYIFRVTDHGRGMNPETVAKITDEFFMEDKSRARKEGGAGLGMSIVESIVRAHGAKLSIESELGVGTTMMIIMPEAQELLSESEELDV